MSEVLHDLDGRPAANAPMLLIAGVERLLKRGELVAAQELAEVASVICEQMIATSGWFHAAQHLRELAGRTPQQPPADGGENA